MNIYSLKVVVCLLLAMAAVNCTIFLNTQAPILVFGLWSVFFLAMFVPLNVYIRRTNLYRVLEKEKINGLDGKEIFYVPQQFITVFGISVWVNLRFLVLEEGWHEIEEKYDFEKDATQEIEFYSKAHDFSDIHSPKTITKLISKNEKLFLDAYGRIEHERNQA